MLAMITMSYAEIKRIMTDREAMKMALERLTMWLEDFPDTAVIEDQWAIDALRQALAQPEQEPVSHLWECLGRWSSYLAVNGTQANMAPPNWLLDAVKAATSQPRKEWVGLTDDEISEVLGGDIHDEPSGELKFIRAIEAKLKEKNYD